MSERQKKLAVLNNYKYSFARKRKDGLMKWKCSNNSCNASLLTKTDKSFHASNGEHIMNHM